MKKIKCAFQLLKNLEKCKEALRIREQFTKEEMTFSESVSRMWGHDYPEEYEDYLYNKAKAERYNLNWDFSVYDPVGLAQAIEEHDWLEVRHQFNYDREYFNNTRVR